MMSMHNTSVTENDDSNMNELLPKDKLIADIIDLQEAVKEKKVAQSKEEEKLYKLQESLRDAATKCLGDSFSLLNHESRNPKLTFSSVANMAY